MYEDITSHLYNSGHAVTVYKAVLPDSGKDALVWKCNDCSTRGIDVDESEDDHPTLG